MKRDTGDCADVLGRLRAYIQALNLDCDSICIEAILASGNTFSGSIELLHTQLAVDFGGDFLAFRLRQGFAANEADFRQPALERQPLPPAPLRHRTLLVMD